MPETAARGAVVLACCFGNCTGKAEGGGGHRWNCSVHVCVCMCSPLIEWTANWHWNQIQNPRSLAGAYLFTSPGHLNWKWAQTGQRQRTSGGQDVVIWNPPPVAGLLLANCTDTLISTQLKIYPSTRVYSGTMQKKVCLPQQFFFLAAATCGSLLTLA